jgi:predicted enzyme related to lactoylglutathione lyase
MRRMPQSCREGELVIVIDCSGLERSARFGADVLGYVAGPASGSTYRSLIPADGHSIEVLLQRTGDDKQHKNRLHLDLRAAGLEGEVERIAGLGASLLTDHPVIEHRWRWHILADAEGNEFCVLQPPAGRLTTS